MGSKQASKNLINLADIARICGVTSMTVSRALRGDSHVAEKTQIRAVHAMQN